MSLRFANVYWSSDLSTSIDRINEQSTRSLQQLHELRKLVFNYMNYYHSNSQYLNKLSIDSYGLESSFRPYDRESSTISRTIPGRIVSSGPRSFRGENYVEKVESDGTSDSNGKSEKQLPNRPPVYIDTAFLLYVHNMTDESNKLMILASVIDKEVLDKITAFLKHYEPEVKKYVSDLEEIYEDYKSVYYKVDKLKREHEEVARLKEFSESEPKEAKTKKDITAGSGSDQDTAPSTPFSTPMKNSTPSTSTTSNEKSLDASSSDNEPEKNEVLHQEESSSALNEVKSPEHEFEFPLFIGTVRLENIEELSSLISGLVEGIPTVKRSIPIPGYRNEIFSSDSLCSRLLKARPRGIDPSRLKLEKFGQSLIDLKLITGTGFLGAKKFKSEGMWFEWSDLAIYVSTYDPAAQKEIAASSPIASPKPKPLPKLPIEETTSKFMNEMAHNTTKRFNGLLNTVKVSLMKTNLSDHLIDVEEKYDDCYLELQELKHIFDRELASRLERLERFEKLRIELTYKSLAKLSEVIYNFSLGTTNRLHEMATDFINRVNKPENYARDFEKLIADFSTGIYFPTLLPGSQNPTQNNNHFQNLKHQFNLFKDIPLQLSLGQDESKDDLLSISSVPIFLYKIVKQTEEKSAIEDNVENIWLSPLDHQDYWNIKEKVIHAINGYEQSGDISSEVDVELGLINTSLNLLNEEALFTSINFLKNWLLEISDSLIPCVVFDSLTSLYKSQSPKFEKVDKISDLVRILGSIPRSNLASLIYILEYISTVFELGQISSYELSDEIQEGLDHDDNTEKLQEVSQKLNSMDSIGAVPFVHLIFRPSVTKNSGGFKPPLDLYVELLAHLLSVTTRISLFKTLVDREKSFLAKKENEKMAVKRHSAPLPPVPTISAPPESPPTPTKSSKIPVNVSPSRNQIPLNGDNFTLRPFRTKPTPNPSPHTSPTHTPKSSLDFTNDGELKPSNLGLPRLTKPRSRSPSLNFAPPTIDVEFEEK
ncbi:uncharacterized protein RJT20DRAFT_126155 [Scheffersomyces xylosifermentans]|uniref:uncharacterized protein n=1 Tax=Scheffersomyces xylosifermentans TaxID=1304137 RepID=UPI00315DF0B7